MSKDVIKPLNKILLSGQITQGKMVEEFENELKNYFDNQYLLTLNNFFLIIDHFFIFN